MSSCCAASAVTGPIEATTVEREQVDGLIEAEQVTKFLTVEALVNVTASICRSSSIR